MVLLFFFRSEYYDYLVVFDFCWEGFDYCQFNQIVFYVVKYFYIDLLVGYFMIVEMQCDFGFIVIFEKVNQVVEFYLIVIFISIRVEFNFFNLDNFLFFFLFFRRFIFFIKEFVVVYDMINWWFGVRVDFN